MRQKILIADDGQSVRKLLARAIGSEPYELLSVCNGNDALDMALTRNPDISSWTAPGTDGHLPSLTDESRAGWVQFAGQCLLTKPRGSLESRF
ncbi:MAG: hypothetical protein ABIG11_06905 [bacterium]